MLLVGCILFLGLFIHSIADRPANDVEMDNFQPALVAVQKHNELIRLVANQ